MMCRLTVTHMVFLSTVSVSNALFVAWEKDANLTSDDIFIEFKNTNVTNNETKHIQNSARDINIRKSQQNTYKTVRETLT